MMPPDWQPGPLFQTYIFTENKPTSALTCPLRCISSSAVIMKVDLPSKNVKWFVPLKTTEAASRGEGDKTTPVCTN